MNDDEFFSALADLAAALDDRVTVVRVIVDEQGREIRRIFRGSFHASPDWRPPTRDARHTSERKD